MAANELESGLVTIESVGVTSWVGDLHEWANAVADRITALAKKYGVVAEGVLLAVDTFRHDPSIANAYNLWDAFVKFRDTAGTPTVLAHVEGGFSLGDWQAAVGLLLQLIDAFRNRKAA